MMMSLYLTLTILAVWLTAFVGSPSAAAAGHARHRRRPQHHHVVHHHPHAPPRPEPPCELEVVEEYERNGVWETVAGGCKGEPPALAAIGGGGLSLAQMMAGGLPWTEAEQNELLDGPEPPEVTPAEEGGPLTPEEREAAP